MDHLSSKILMISPVKFRNNEHTLSDNVFQSIENKTDKIQFNALKEFDKLRNVISKSGINVFSFNDDSDFDTPDAVFPNNWISFHNSNKAILYPMYAPNRRFERESNLLNKLSGCGIDIKLIKDYSIHENENKFLEGTGSIVLDRKSKKAYCSLSKRSNLELFKIFCKDMGYLPIVFNSSYQSKPIYHTNVMMSICNNFAIVCLETIINKKEKENIIKNLYDSGLEIINISLDQMTSFLGNCIQLTNSKFSPILVMSSRAFKSISRSQLKLIENHTDIIHSDIKTIEDNGGGSARCMIAEIF
tara:strand:- start:33727 stop:34632 length:906 start_codon:yes stop_codon:yes gene_type:complete